MSNVLIQPVSSMKYGVPATYPTRTSGDVEIRTRGNGFFIIKGVSALGKTWMCKHVQGGKEVAHSDQTSMTADIARSILRHTLALETDSGQFAA
jgi:hypothetical protein